MGRSADLAFGNIARQMGFVGKERLHQAMPQALQRGMSLEQLLVETGEINPEQWGKVIELRLRFGRKCTACGEITYLMGKVPPCEQCGGQLQLQPGDDQSRGRYESSARIPVQRPPSPPTAPPQRPVAPSLQSPMAPPPQRAAAPPPRPTAPPARPAAPVPGPSAPPPRPSALPPRPTPVAQAAPAPPQPTRPTPPPPPRRPEPAPELASMTMMDEELEFEEVVEDPTAGAGKLFQKRGKKKTPEEPAIGPAASDDLPSGDALERMFSKATSVEKPGEPSKAEEAEPPAKGGKDSGHFQFKTFSFRRSQLGLDALAAEEAIRESDEAEKKGKGKGKEAEDLHSLASQVTSATGTKKAPAASSGSSRQFKISGSPAPAGKSIAKSAGKSNTKTKMIAGVVAVLACASCVVFFPLDLLLVSYDWQFHRKTATLKAKSERKLLVEYTTDPNERPCVVFRQQVLEDSEVFGLKDQFVWYKEIIDVKVMPDTIKYSPPYVFIYSSDGKTVLAGSRTAGELSASQFRQMLLEAQQKAQKS